MKKQFYHIELISFVLLLLSVSISVGATEVLEKKSNLFVNQHKLDSIFKRLYELEETKEGRINIVHLGDSHIQADFLTNEIRSSLQSRFGNAGLGFSFPYRLANTNGTKAVKFQSNATWESRSNVSLKSSLVDIGLSGIGFYTTDTIFALQLETIDDSFNSIKVFYSTEKPQYEMSLTANDSIKYIATRAPANRIIHKIKSGESLSTIARRYKTTVTALKRENNMRNDRIQAGKSLRIPSSKTTKVIRKMEKKKFEYLDVNHGLFHSSYTYPDSTGINKITLLPKSGFKHYDISGFILENNNPGIIYHTIGVNGAKVADFNRLPLFFEQMRSINPDLVIVSFGTNESFQKLAANEFEYNLRELIARLRKNNPTVTVLITTPPPSLMRRRNSNPLAKAYQERLEEMTDFPVWDLYESMGGEKGIRLKGKYAHIIARDKIHYTENGYRVQADLFVQDFLKAYDQYKEKKH